jgi:hypothetical protein
LDTVDIIISLMEHADESLIKNDNDTPGVIRRLNDQVESLRVVTNDLIRNDGNSALRQSFDLNWNNCFAFLWGVVLKVEGFETFRNQWASFLERQRQFSDTLATINRAAVYLSKHTDRVVEDSVRYDYGRDRFYNSWWMALYATLTIIALMVTINLAITAYDDRVAYFTELATLIPEKGSNLFIVLYVLPKLSIFLLSISVTVVFLKLFLTHNHLKVAARNKEAVARIVPLLQQELSPEKRLDLFKEFLQVAAKQDDSFMTQVKHGVNINVPQIK